jgi:type II secretory ATPase GspE/PulE/Tfp pilus assembly ATPase PilB-like protein
MTNVWSGNAKQPQFEKWNTAALHATTLKSDAEALQKTNKDAQKADKTAMDTANALVTSTLKTYTDDKATTAKKLAASTAAAKKVTDEATTVSAADKTANAAAAKTAKDAHTTATTAEAKSKTAWDNAVTAAVAPTTKYDQISTWVVSGATYIHNDWDGSQAW